MSRVQDGIESNYAERTHEALFGDFPAELMKVREMNYTGSVANNMGRFAVLYDDLLWLK